MKGDVKCPDCGLVVNCAENDTGFLCWCVECDRLGESTESVESAIDDFLQK